MIIKVYKYKKFPGVYIALLIYYYRRYIIYYFKRNWPQLIKEIVSKTLSKKRLKLILL